MKPQNRGTYKAGDELTTQKKEAAKRGGGGCVARFLTHEGGGRQFALVQAVDGAEGAHHATDTQAVQHLPCLDQSFTCLACRKFAVRL